MKLRHLALILSILTLWVVAAQAAGPVVGPFATADQNFKAGNESALPLANKAFGDPTDLKAAAMAAADYLRYMQADVTEDNAGNGDPDSPVDDPDDAGWDYFFYHFEVNWVGWKLLNLRLEHVDLVEGTLRVEDGKGRKQV